MAKSRKLEELLARLAQIQAEPTSGQERATLRHVLSSKFSIAIARAAKLAVASALSEWIPDLVAAFDQLIHSAKEMDQGCLAKHAIAEALYRLDYSDETDLPTIVLLPVGALAQPCIGFFPSTAGQYDRTRLPDNFANPPKFRWNCVPILSPVL
jgi:hypothetical protein